MGKRLHEKRRPFSMDSEDRIGCVAGLLAMAVYVVAARFLGPIVKSHKHIVLFFVFSGCWIFVKKLRQRLGRHALFDEADYEAAQRRPKQSVRQQWPEILKVSAVITVAVFFLAVIIAFATGQRIAPGELALAIVVGFVGCVLFRCVHVAFDYWDERDNILEWERKNPAEKEETPWAVSTHANDS